MTEPFNPLAMDSLATSIVTRMMEMEAVPLDDVQRFVGAGLYAIYYRGSFAAYNLLTRENLRQATVPIYVGKAVPSGSRKGLDVTAAPHTRSLAEAKNTFVTEKLLLFKRISRILQQQVGHE